MEAKKTNLTENDIAKDKQNAIDTEKLLKELAINKSVSNGKYKYPNELKDLDSKDPKKKHYRNKIIQPTLKKLLSIENPTKDNLIQFNKAIELFFNSFNNVNQFTDVTEIYKIQNEAKKKFFASNLKKYQAIK